MKSGPCRDYKKAGSERVFNVVGTLSLKPTLHWHGSTFVSSIQQIGEPPVNCCSGLGAETKAFVSLFRPKRNPAACRTDEKAEQTK